MQRSTIIIITAVMASLLEIIDTSIVNVAVPTMMGNLGATLEDISWVITGYIIANAIVLPIAGWLGVQIGRKKYYTGCILLFTATSVGCGFAPNLTTLIVFRVLQGLAGGALLPTSQALIQEAFPKEKAGMASAIYGMSIMIGPTVGPTLGGYLTDNFGWRSIFNINLPLGLLAALMAWLNVEDIRMAPQKDGSVSERAARTKIDFVGLMLLVVGVGCLQFVLERGEPDDWFASNSILACSVVALVALPTFILWELKVPYPIIDLRLFKHTAVRYGTLLMMEIGAILYAVIFFIPVFCSVVIGLTATQTGLLFIPGALASAAMMPVIGMQLRKRDPRLLIFLGITVLEIAIFWMTHFNGLTSAEDMFWPLLLRGGAMAFLFVPVNTLVLGQFSGPQLGQVAGLLNLFRQLGGSIGIAALSTLLTVFRAQDFLDLTSHVSLLNPTTVQTYQATLHGFTGRSASLGFQDAHAAALKAIGFRIQKQVFVLSYEKALWYTMFLFLLSLLPLSQLKAKKGAKVSAADIH